ncbi:MAG: hypothetical protein WC978_05630 [bacterium]
MIRSRRTRLLLVIAATLGLAAAAWAEGIFPVNDTGNGNWVFDQPSVVANGTVLHVAFVGDNAAGADNASLNTRLYYAAVNGGADFTNKTTTRDQVRLTAPVAIDNGDAYTDARHPQIALRSATELEILFQAIPVGDTNYKLFLALVTIDNNAVKTQQVKEVLNPVSGRITGNLVDPSFALVASDNSLRVAYTDNSTGYGNVYYSRVGWDNAFLVGSPILLTPGQWPLTRGTAPRPRLRLEGTTRSHIAWAAETATATSVIYYSMVKEASPGVDNLAIGATSVLSGPYRWGFPNVLLPTASRVLILAGVDSGTIGEPGYLGTAYLNPDAVTHDGNPVTVWNLIPGASFFVFPPGSNTPLSSIFSVYHPEASLDASNRIHVAGYGSATGAYFNAGTYFTMSLLGITTTTTTAGNIADLISPGVPVGTDNLAFAMSLTGDYTRPAFMHLSGKAVHFWSGADNTVDGARNLYVTSTLSSTDVPVPTKQSGCSMVDDPRRGEAGRIPGAAVLLLPAALLALRRATRKAFAR